MKPLLAAALFACAPIALSACAGFQPLHATPAGQAAFSDMRVEVGQGTDEADRQAGFYIRQALKERMNAPDTPTYLLRISPQSRRVGIGLTGQDFATRFDGVVTARWRLVRQADGAAVASGTTSGVATYSADLDPYRLQTTSDQATQRASREVANKLLEEIALTLPRIAADAATPAP